jgi:hypothetical protein
MMRFSANMTNDDHSVVPIEVKLNPQRMGGAGLGLAISLARMTGGDGHG